MKKLPDYGGFALKTIFNQQIILPANQLIWFERQYKKMNHEHIDLLFLDIPLNVSYEVFTLVPKEFTTGLTVEIIETLSRIRTYIKSSSGNQGLIDYKKFLMNEIRRIDSILSAKK